MPVGLKTWFTKWIGTEEEKEKEKIFMNPKTNPTALHSNSNTSLHSNPTTNPTALQSNSNHSLNTPNHVSCIEVDWWQNHSFNENITLIATPVQHWSCRHLWKQNDSLWNSWIVVGTKRKIFFGGDTSYCPVFSQIGKMYGPFDLSFLPIGSYCPRESQKSSHVDPAEAIQIHQEIKSKLSIGMHFGTFQFTNVFFSNPSLFFLFKISNLFKQIIKQKKGASNRTTKPFKGRVIKTQNGIN